MNLETEVEIGISTPLGILASEKAPDVVVVCGVTVVAVVLLETRVVEDETVVVEEDTDDPELEDDVVVAVEDVDTELLLVSARRFIPPLNVKLVLSVDEVAVVSPTAVEDRVVVEARVVERVVVVTRVVDRVVDSERVVDRVVDSRVVDKVVDSTRVANKLVVFVVAASITSDDEFVTSRASLTGCVAFGFRPRILTLLSESGILTSATTTSTMATIRRAMTPPMKGHPSAVGL